MSITSVSESDEPSAIGVLCSKGFSYPTISMSLSDPLLLKLFDTVTGCSVIVLAVFVLCADRKLNGSLLADGCDGVVACGGDHITELDGPGIGDSQPELAVSCPSIAERKSRTLLNSGSNLTTALCICSKVGP